jgi:hypothetical protein
MMDHLWWSNEVIPRTKHIHSYIDRTRGVMEHLQRPYYVLMIAAYCVLILNKSVRTQH